MQKDNKITVALIDDHKLFREGVKRLLNFETSMQVVADGDGRDETLQIVEENKPDVVLMDINMPEVNGIEITKELIEKYPDIKIIMLSIHDDKSYVTDALQSGAQGYLLKEVDTETLIDAIKIVANGGSYVHPKVTHDLIEDYRRLAQESHDPSFVRVEHRKPLHLLTKRECQILQLLAEGQSNRKISETLVISEKTVKNHVSNILQKMQVKDRTQAVVTAIRNGWVEVNI